MGLLVFHKVKPFVSDSKPCAYHVVPSLFDVCIHQMPSFTWLEIGKVLLNQSSRLWDVFV